MSVLALRRNPSLSLSDPLIDECYDNSKASLNKLMSKSDYVLVAAPLTKDTVDLVDSEALSHSKKDLVIINVGRGPIINEPSLISSLRTKKIRGAALDVFTVEPLPEENELWELENVLVSPHNMDQTETFMREGELRSNRKKGAVWGRLRGEEFDFLTSKLRFALIFAAAESFCGLVQGWVRGDDEVGNTVDKAAGY